MNSLPEKAMATHSITLAWKIPCTEEPGGLQFMASHRVGHDWSNLAAAAVAAEQPSEVSIQKIGIKIVLFEFLSLASFSFIVFLQVLAFL